MTTKQKPLSCFKRHHLFWLSPVVFEPWIDKDIPNNVKIYFQKYRLIDIVWSYPLTLGSNEKLGFFALKSIRSANSAVRGLHKDWQADKWQLMSALASFEMFGEEDLIFINWRSCRHCLQNEWPFHKKS